MRQEHAAPAALASVVVWMGALGCAETTSTRVEHALDRRQTAVVALETGCGNRFVQGDFDRDGASDYACLYGLGESEAAILVTRGTASGPTEDVWWHGSTGRLDADRCARFVSGDFTGDGRSDLACLYDHGTGLWEAFVFTSTGSSFTIGDWARWPLEAFDPRRCRGPVVAGDFNGDLESDLGCLYDDDGDSHSMTILASAEASLEQALWQRTDAGDFDPVRCGSRLVPGDFDGDGRAELACLEDGDDAPPRVHVVGIGEDASVLETSSAAVSGEIDSQRCGDRFLAGDFDGDGRTDLACMYDQVDGAAGIFVLRSNGSGLRVETWHERGRSDLDASRCDGRLAVGKLDGDDLDDLACIYDLGVASGYPHGSSAQSHLLAFLSTGTDFRLTVWPDDGRGPAALDASSCSDRLYVGRTPSPYAGGALWGTVSCGIDYGSLGVGVRHHLLNPSLLEFERPIRAVGDPLHAARGTSSPRPPGPAPCRAVETMVYDQPTLDHADVEYRQATLSGDTLVLVGAEPPTQPFVVWIPPSATPTEMIHGQAGYGGGVTFGDAFAALAAAHPGMIRMVSFDEPYIFHAPLSHDKDKIRVGHAPFKDVLVDAAKTIHAHGIPVWINFSRPELELMLEEPPVPLNSPHFDVVSVDWYHHGPAFQGPSDVPRWFAENVEPLLDALHDLRLPVAWRPDYAGQRQHEILVTDGFVYEPWNAREIENVNALFYEYNAWARSANAGQDDPSVILMAPYAWSEHIVYNGLAVVPRLRRYWDAFNALPLCR